MKRKILFFGNYFPDFYSSQDNKSKEKIDFVLDLIRNVDRVPSKFMKAVEGTIGLYEIRISIFSGSIRIFSCFDEGKLVILFNCFVKKTNKIPRKQINKGIKLRAEYFANKTRRK